MKINHLLIKSFYPLLFIACQNNFSTDNSADKIKEAFAVKNEISQNFFPNFGFHKIKQPLVLINGSESFMIRPINDHSIALDREVFDTHENYQYIPLDKNDLVLEEGEYYSFELSSFENNENLIIELVQILFRDYQNTLIKNNPYPGKVNLSEVFDEVKHRELILRENEILKRIWKEEISLTEGMKKWKMIQNERFQSLDTDKKQMELKQVTLDGHAAYLESLTKLSLKKSSENYQNYNPEEDMVLENIQEDQYWIALGYNMTKVLEKFSPNYRLKIYQEDTNLIDCMDELHYSILRFEKSITMI